MIIRILFAGLAVLLSLTSAGAQRSSYAIVGADGTPVVNHVVPAATGDDIARLPAVVGVGNPQGDVTIYEFYDLNCPFCRKASADLRAMLSADRQLNVVLVPFPVLGIPSIQAGRVEFALARMATPQQFYAFHQKMFSARGVVDGARALEGAKELGFAREKMIEAANAETITDAMKAHVRLGDRLQMEATPSLVVQDVAIVGYPGRAAMETIVGAVRQCGRAAC